MPKSKLKSTFILCTKDLYSLYGVLHFKAGKFYEVMCENYDGFDLRNLFGDAHNVTFDGWLQYFVQKDRRVLVEKVRTYRQR